jgi:homogentisate 1,2-dioxygenase
MNPPSLPKTSLIYMSGFGNEFVSEAIAGALPEGRNSPQRAPHDLYTELLSGTAFTAPRAENRRTWLYRRQPSVMTGAYRLYAQPLWISGAAGGRAVPPDPLRWSPFEIPLEALDFVDGIRTLVANGDADSQTGMAAHIYVANRSMAQRAVVNADGEMLLIPQQGRIVVTTELGVLDVKPGEVVVVPRGMAFSVALPDGASRGYLCENYGAHFRLPELGPIGSKVWLMRATFWLPQRLLMRALRLTSGSKSSKNTAAVCGQPGSRAVRSMWWPGTATWCLTNTTPPTS